MRMVILANITRLTNNNDIAYGNQSPVRLDNIVRLDVPIGWFGKNTMARDNEGAQT